MTALRIACGEINEEMVKILIKLGCDVNVPDSVSIFTAQVLSNGRLPTF